MDQQNSFQYFLISFKIPRLFLYDPFFWCETNSIYKPLHKWCLHFKFVYCIYILLIYKLQCIFFYILIRDTWHASKILSSYVGTTFVKVFFFYITTFVKLNCWEVLGCMYANKRSVSKYISILSFHYCLWFVKISVTLY